MITESTKIELAGALAYMYVHRELVDWIDFANVEVALKCKRKRAKELVNAWVKLGFVKIVDGEKNGDAAVRPNLEGDFPIYGKLAIDRCETHLN